MWNCVARFAELVLDMQRGTMYGPTRRGPGAKRHRSCLRLMPN
jgi:hypothetical protein